MVYFDRLDHKRPEPRGTLRLVALGGMLAAGPVIVLGQLLEAIGPADTTGPAGVPTTYLGALWLSLVIAAIPEELAKSASVYLFAWKRPEFDERMDGIAYGARAGLGFALVENVAYLVLLPDDLRQYLVLLVARALLVVPGHAIWGGIAGYFAARKRFDGRGPGWIGGLAIAIAMHAAYDLWVFGAPVAVAHGHYGIAWSLGGVPVLLYAGPVLLVAGGALLLRRCAQIAIALDDLAEAEGRLSSMASMAVVLPDDPVYTAGGTLIAPLPRRMTLAPHDAGSSERLGKSPKRGPGAIREWDPPRIER